MKTTIETTEGKTLVTFDGTLDSYIAQEVGEQLEPLFELSDTDIILDCTNLEYIASSGLRLFLLLLKQVSANGCNVYVKGVNQKLMDIFDSTGFKPLFQFI